jgi:hypothetical protein
VHLADDAFDHQIDLLGGVEAAQTEANRALREIVAGPDRP